MPSLRDLKNRIASVKSTRKITSAMKMVAASKLRRAQETAEAARPYAERMARMLASLSGNLVVTASTPRLISGTGGEDTVCWLWSHPTAAFAVRLTVPSYARRAVPFARSRPKAKQ